jgi:hypothetical protein
MFEKLDNLGYGGAHLNTRLPKALAELQGLTFTGPVAGALADTAIAVPSIEVQDTIAKVINMTDLVEVDLATVASVDRRAKGTVTVINTVADGDYVTVNGKKYTFKNMVVNPSTNVTPGIVPVTITTGVCAVNPAAIALANAIMSRDSTLTCSVLAAAVTVICRTAGVAGNAITLTTSSVHCTVSGAVLAGGTATNGITITSDTSDKKLLVIWFKKSRLQTQW